MVCLSGRLRHTCGSEDCAMICICPDNCCICVNVRAELDRISRDTGDARDVSCQAQVDIRTQRPLLVGQPERPILGQPRQEHRRNLFIHREWRSPARDGLDPIVCERLKRDRGFGSSAFGQCRWFETQYSETPRSCVEIDTHCIARRTRQDEPTSGPIGIDGPADRVPNGWNKLPLINQHRRPTLRGRCEVPPDQLCCRRLVQPQNRSRHARCSCCFATMRFS